MPLQGKGKESLAQRSLPLRPPPETWGTPPSPIPPLGTKGRNCGLNTVAPTGSAALRLPTGVLPRKRLAYSAPGGASPLSSLETPLRRKGWASAPAFGNHLQRIESGSGKRSRWCSLCSQINAIPADARMQLFKEHLSAQLAGDFWILSAVRTGRSFVWVS